METTTLEGLTEAFLNTRAGAESFSVSELTAFAAANLPGAAADDAARKRLIRDIELLLEGKPLDIVIEALAALAAVADAFRLVVGREVVIEAGVLGFTLVTLFHSGNGGLKVNGNAPGTVCIQVHAHEGKFLIQ